MIDASQFLEVCKGGNVPEVEQTLNDRVRVNEPDLPQDITAEHGQLEVIQLLLEQGTNISDANGEGFTPLILACKNGHVKVVELLLEKGINVNNMVMSTSPCESGTTTPLFIAASNGHHEVVALLLENGAQVDLATGFGATPLYIAAKEGHVDVVKVLLKYGATGRPRDPLYSAIEKGHWEIVSLLIGAGLAFSLPSLYQRQFGLALEHDSVDLAALLLRNHQKQISEYNICDVISRTTVHSTNMLQMLLENGGNLPPIKRTQQLYHAVQNKQVDKVWLLVLQAGADTESLVPDQTQKVWQLCKGDKATRQALLHFWTPRSHKFHSPQVRKAIVCVLLSARRLNWPFDSMLMEKLLGYVAYEWPKHAEFGLASREVTSLFGPEYLAKSNHLVKLFKQLQ